MFKKLLGASVMVLGSAGTVLADGFTPPTIDTANVLLIAGAVFTAIAAIWFVKKGIKLLNRS
jgi:hypothetical protein